MVLGEKNFNQDLADLNKDLRLQLDKYQQDLSTFKSYYQIKEGAHKDHQILEHVYLKTKHELHNLVKANKAIELKNNSLTMKVA